MLLQTGVFVFIYIARIKNRRNRMLRCMRATKKKWLLSTVLLPFKGPNAEWHIAADYNLDAFHPRYVINVNSLNLPVS